MAITARQAADPLGRAMRDYQRGTLGTLRYRDGATTQDGRVAEYYFESPEHWADERIAVLERIANRDGPVLDVGCGAGQYACWLQERGLEVTGIDASPHAVEAAREQGLENARVMDMFDLTFDPGRFATVQVFGTQLGLAASFAGVRELLGSVARITDEDGVAVVDNYDPNAIADDLLGYRPDPRDGVAHRCFHLEYEPNDESETVVGPTLHFLLFGPDRLADATIGTPWRVADIVREERTYVAVLEKSA
ncbi:methyltransferase type 11 [Natronococcus pandeyae]|uniref:Methyltransferase type 11 n=1 Tax=Natronococcus pandeyae TaxID=2055836 RepID=A0A8J8Q5K8_9EURY|nr:class I SAM-dependent methyltransferase [Natronococcus pandeyae]TYL39736.1 methyltransferase type 11 [Natronococcus pandeyae]